MHGMVGVIAGETAIMADHLELLEDLDQTEISSHLLSKLKHAQLMCRAALEEELDRLGLTVTQFLALAFIDEHGAEISSAELARRSYVSPQAMMTIVARMEAAKLISRAPASCGGRTLCVTLTAEGQRLLERGRVHAVAIERYLLDLLGDDAFGQFLAALDTITFALGQGATLKRTTPWEKYLPPDETAG
jgi:DNA-binding MarR family transcriptional regulator